MHLYFTSHALIILLLSTLNLSNMDVEKSRSNPDHNGKQTESQSEHGGVTDNPASSTAGNGIVDDTFDNIDSEADSVQGTFLPEQKYRKLFEHNRAIQLEAVKSVQEFGDYAQRYKLVKVMLDQLFKVMSEAKKNLTLWGYIPGDPLPNNSTLMEAMSNVLENTAMFGDLVLRLPDIVHDMYDRNKEWQILMAWSWWFCFESQIFEGSSAVLLDLMAQEIDLIPKEESYHNPFKSVNQIQEQGPEDTKNKQGKKSKKKKERRKGPRLSGQVRTEL